MRHYRNVVTLEVKGGHIILKSKFEVSTSNSLTFVININSLL